MVQYEESTYNVCGPESHAGAWLFCPLEFAQTASSCSAHRVCSVTSNATSLPNAPLGCTYTSIIKNLQVTLRFGSILLGLGIFAVSVLFSDTRLKHKRDRHEKVSRQKNPNWKPSASFAQYDKFAADRSMAAVYFTIVFSIVLGNVGGQVSQRRLSVLNSNAMADASSFLGPFIDMFQFFEIGSTVKIGFLVGQAAGDPEKFADLGRYTKMLLVLSFVCGLPAAILSTCVCYFPLVRDFFVPLRETGILPSACPIYSPRQTVSSDLVRPYWLLKSWSWPASFANKVANGVLFGFQDFYPFALLTVVNMSIDLAFCFLLTTDVNADPSYNPMLVGLAEFVSSLVTMLVFVYIFFGRRKYREKLRLSEPMFKGEESRQGCFSKLRTMLRYQNLGKDGLNLMLRDMSGAILGSMTTQLLSRWGLGVQYKMGSEGGQSQQGFFMVTIGFELFIRFVLPGFIAAKDTWSYKHFLHEFMFLGCGITVALVTVFHLITPLMMYGAVAGGFYAAMPLTLCDSLIYSCGNSVFAQATSNAAPFYIVSAISAAFGQISGVFSTVVLAFQDFTFIRNLSLASFVVQVVVLWVFAAWFRNQIWFLAAGFAVTVVMMLVFIVRWYKYLNPAFLMDSSYDDDYKALPSQEEKDGSCCLCRKA